ncbi:Hypothetical protein PHPALM_4734, partial [Phytophthora palmivora]
MPKKASTRGASAPSKSKTARSKTAKAKSKDKSAPRKEVRKAASEAGSKRTAAAASQEGSSRSLSPDDRPNPRFAYQDHSPGSESPEFNIPMITGSESDGDSPGSAKDPSSSQDASSQDAPAQDAPSQDAPADDTESSEAKAASTSSPAKNLTLIEARSPWLSYVTSIAKGFKSLFDSSDEDEEEGAVFEPQEISNDLDEQQEHYQAAQLQGTPVPPTP